MKQTKRTKVTIETERLLIVGSLRGQVEVWCNTCRAEVRMVSVEEAAIIAGVSQRVMYHQIESGRLHFGETSRGALLICLDALLKQTHAEG